MNAMNSIKNTTANLWNSDAVQSIAEPIQDSYNAALDKNADAVFSIPVMILLGVMVVVFILFILFRDTIIFGLQVAWLKVKGWFSPSEPAVQPPPPEFAPEGPQVEKSAVEKILPGKKQVFNIAANRFKYSDAEPLCKAFGAELATYDQVKEAWSKGADWCNYGWVKGQAAIYPTQQATYDKLQAGPEGQRQACGKVGLNGGFFDNPEMRFGVNCYGMKPSQSKHDAADQSKGIPISPDALDFDKKVAQYKADADNIGILPFRTGAWSS